MNSDGPRAGSFPLDIIMKNISGTNITEHKSRVTVQHLFIAVTVVAARGGNLTNKNYKIGHAGLGAVQKPFCEKEFIGRFCILTHAGELHSVMWARLQQRCHQHLNPHQSESSFKSHLVADWCEFTLAWLVAPFWVHFANLTLTVQTAMSEKAPKHAEKSNSYTMDHLLVLAIGEQTADVKTCWDNRAVCQTNFVGIFCGINKDSWTLEAKTQSKSHSSITESKRILKRFPCVERWGFVAVLFYIEAKCTSSLRKSQLKYKIISY